LTLLALLRHGDTAWTAEGRIQGRTDPIHFSVEPSLKVRDSTRPAAVEPTA